MTNPFKVFGAGLVEIARYVKTNWKKVLLVILAIPVVFALVFAIVGVFAYGFIKLLVFVVSIKAFDDWTNKHPLVIVYGTFGSVIVYALGDMVYQKGKKALNKNG